MELSKKIILNGKEYILHGSCNWAIYKAVTNNADAKNMELFLKNVLEPSITDDEIDVCSDTELFEVFSEYILLKKKLTSEFKKKLSI